MSIRRLAVTLIVTLLLVAGCAAPAAAPPVTPSPVPPPAPTATPNVPRVAYDPAGVYEVEERDVEYRRDGSQARMARVFQPKGTGPFPLLIDLHPGAWTTGDRYSQGNLDRALSRSGIVVISPDFRLSGEEPYPAAMVDANYVVRWAKAHAKDFNAAATNVGLMGGSSGGQMAIVGGMRPLEPRYSAMTLAEAPNVDASVAYVMGWGAPLDPYARYLFAQETKRGDLIVAHDAYFKTTDAMKDASAQVMLERGEKVALPPILLIHSTADENVPITIIEKFVASYRAAGGSIQLEKFESRSHLFLSWPSTDFGRGVQAMKEFIARQWSK